MIIAAIDHIAINPKICHGQPYIAGTRIRVQDIIMFQRNGWDAEQIAANFENLRLSQIYAALAYYYDHQTEIDDEIMRVENSIPQSGGKHLQELRSRLKIKK